MKFSRNKILNILEFILNLDPTQSQLETIKTLSASYSESKPKIFTLKQIKPYMLKSIPNWLSVEFFISRLRKYESISGHDLLLGVYIFFQIISFESKIGKKKFDNFKYKLFISCLSIAQKLLNDVPLNNTAFAFVCTVSPKVLQDIETRTIYSLYKKNVDICFESSENYFENVMEFLLCNSN